MSAEASTRSDRWGSEVIVGRALGYIFGILYGPLAPWYDAVSWLVSGGRWRSWQRAALAKVKGPAVLEVGCGPGHLALDLAQRGVFLIALDRSRRMCVLTRRRLRDRPNGFVVQADACALPFPAGMFDSLVATFPAGYIVDTQAAREFARVAQPGGALVVVLGVESFGLAWRLYSRLINSSGTAARFIGRLLDQFDAAGWHVELHTAEVAGDQVAVLAGERIK